MADQKTSELTEQTAPTHQDDELYSRDLSETTAANQSKRIAHDTFFNRVLCYDGDPLTYDDELLIY